MTEPGRRDQEPFQALPPDPQPARQLPPEQSEAPQPLPERYPFWSFQDVFLVGAISLPLLVISFVAVNSVFWAIGFAPRERVVRLLSAQFLFYLLWLLFLYAWFKLRYGRPFWRSVAFVVPPQGLWGSLGWGILTAIGVIVLGALLRPPEMEVPLMELLRSELAVLLVGSFAVTLGPLFEELAFRGFLQPLLVRVLTPVPGILITAVLFALLHGPEYAWSWRHLILITLAGSAFGFVRHRTGSTATATVMHAAYNLTFFLGVVAQRNVQL
jgi:membrane protease YdiL (CAAX protease family)